MDEKLRDELMAYCKIETDVDDTEISDVLIPLYHAATALIYEQTAKSFSEIPFKDSKAEQRRMLYWLAIKMIVSHWYDHRGMIEEKTFSDIPYNAAEIIKIIGIDGDYK